MRLIPKQEKFHELFRTQSGLIVEAASLLVEIIRKDGSEDKQISSRIADIERQGDAVFREISEKLQKTFITPIDPEDIHRLAARQEDVIDGIEECAFRLVTYRLDPIPAAVIELGDIILAASQQLAAAVEALEQERPVYENTREITRLEERADDLLREAEVELFTTETDPLRLLKRKEVLEYMESVTDLCEDAGDVLENIAVKNA